MRSLRILVAVAVIAVSMVALLPGATQAAPLAQQNLLSNPDFEDKFVQFAHYSTALVSSNWLPWWRQQAGDDPAWKNRMPEYKQARSTDQPVNGRVHNGASAQQLFSFFGTHVGGIYQTVGNIAPGSKVTFSIWGHAWAGSSDDPTKSTGGGPMHMRVGIDPNGGTDPGNSGIVWSGEKNPLSIWELFVVETTAKSNKVTVFTWSAPDYPTQHNDVYWDQATLTASSPAPAQAPTNTPRPAVQPRATYTPAPPTETPTVTPTPTNTATPTPVNTATPTVTPTPTWTPTPMTGEVCVLAYDDRNGNRLRDPGEPLLPYAVFTLSDAQHVVSTYSTNGLNEPYCFENLNPSVYFVSEMNPPGYESTTFDSWGVSLQNGATINIEFGDQTAREPTPTPSPTPQPSPTPVALLSTIGNAVYNYSGIILIVLAVGVLIAFNAARRSA